MVLTQTQFCALGQACLSEKWDCGTTLQACGQDERGLVECWHVAAPDLRLVSRLPHRILTTGDLGVCRRPPSRQQNSWDWKSGLLDLKACVKSVSPLMGSLKFLFLSLIFSFIMDLQSISQPVLRGPLSALLLPPLLP